MTIANVATMLGLVIRINSDRANKQKPIIKRTTLFEILSTNFPIGTRNNNALPPPSNINKEY